MTDPKRLLSGGGTGLERQLLQAVAREQPTADLRLRMQRNLGLGTSVVGSKAASLLGQVALATLIAAGIADTRGVEPTPSRNAVAPSALSASSSPAPSSVVLGGPSNARPALPLSAAPTAMPSPPDEAESGAVKELPPSGGTGPAAARGARLAAPENDQALRDEIRLLDRARAALQAGTPRKALSELALYSARFPRGTFRQEASVLRVEALTQNGERARASALAREFVARHPNSPHVERVERVTGADR